MYEMSVKNDFPETYLYKNGFTQGPAAPYEDNYSNSHNVNVNTFTKT